MLATLGNVKFLLNKILVYPNSCISNNFVYVVMSTHNSEKLDNESAFI